MFRGPIYRIFGKLKEKHPFAASSSNSNIDFWGPCCLVSFYGFILWLGKVKDIPWIYVIWCLASFLNHLVCRVWYNSTIMMHASLLGYSVTPIIPIAAIILLISPPVWISTILESICIVWSASAAVLSYYTILIVSIEHKNKLKLLIPAVILMEIYLISLIPIRHKDK
jgi:hypothetical protein